jgi:glycine cleavage system H protein
MNPFVYTDIFDTKGIEYIVVILFLLLLIPFWSMLNRPLKSRARLKEATAALTAGILRIPQGLFFSRNHTWSRLEPSGLARVGMDDLLLHLTGGVEVSFLQKEGTQVRKGDALIRIIQDGKELALTSPVTGEVTLVNESLGDDPEAIMEDPYGSWLCMIRPEDWQGETADCYLAGRASNWMKEELVRFKDFLSGALSGSEFRASPVVLQEGGELTDFPLSWLGKEVWDLFQEKFLENNT